MSKIEVSATHYARISELLAEAEWLACDPNMPQEMKDVITNFIDNFPAYYNAELAALRERVIATNKRRLSEIA